MEVRVTGRVFVLDFDLDIPMVLENCFEPSNESDEFHKAPFR